MQDIEELLSQAKAWEAMESIMTSLFEQRANNSGDAWKKIVEQDIRNSKLREYAHLCKLTKRNFEKPRGYAGDAVMMDYIYGLDNPYTDDEKDVISEEIYRYTTNSPASRAVRYRRGLLANYIDSVCLKKSHRTRIAAIACGHLREFELSLQGSRAFFEKFVAFDQDAESLKVVDAEYGKYGVEARKGNIRDLIVGRKHLEGKYDLIYSAGLYDYLTKEVAIKLTRNLFLSLESKGVLLLANFLPDIPDVGYMESLMDWWLI